jgi:hypothetical protein
LRNFSVAHLLNTSKFGRRGTELTYLFSRLRRVRLRGAAVMAALGVLVLVAAACDPPASGGGGSSTGTIEICKDAANGMTGKVFSFRLNNGTPFNVTGGSCSGPKSAPAGTNTVTETPAAGTELQSVSVTPPGNAQGVNLATSTATVTVTGGSTAANETLVRFFNQPQGGTTGLLKVCKAAADSSLIGSSFSFTENGGPAFSVAAGSAGAPNCDGGKQYDVGTRVNVAELASAGTHVASITVSDGRGSNVSTSNGTVTATVGTGTTIVTYTNALNLPAQKGYIEVCKDAGDQFVTGSFTFTITAPSFTDTESVRVGQCSGAIQVPAGNVNVAEAPRAPFQVAAITTEPSGRLVTSNLANGTATVTVPVSSSSADETLVRYRNVTRTGSVKVCKTLDANAAAFAGATFTFDISSAAGADVVNVVAGAAGTTACKFYPIALPIGSQVSITERNGADFQLTGVVVSPSSADAGSSGSTAKLTVQSGVTIATFTNRALGTIEVCKNAADASTATQSFQFSVNGGTPFSVRAGDCSPTIRVPAGTATVRETVPANFELANVSANDSHLLSGPTDNPATVSVSTGGVATETVVTFTDRVKTGQFKICKASPEPTLQNTAFNFTSSYTVNGSTVNGTASLKPGDCSGLSAPIPVVDAQGNPITVNVTEAPTASVVISSIVVDGAGSLTASNTTTGTASFTQGNGIATITYTNVRAPVTAAGFTRMM